jgi:hypothetical protein
MSVAVSMPVSVGLGSDLKGAVRENHVRITNADDTIKAEGPPRRMSLPPPAINKTGP